MICFIRLEQYRKHGITDIESGLEAQMEQHLVRIAVPMRFTILGAAVCRINAEINPAMARTCFTAKFTPPKRRNK